ncbi:hypothetical protein BDW22DRAFT_1428785 [Trametopsis cervina]|nr:hypothetical protein BDW22DRAFT_1428785 [Trametopsis cervina]
MVAGCNFPQEISDSIIDCLADDHGALKACALTRRAWLHRSRHHLHRKVTIDSGVYRRKDYYSTPAAQHIRHLKLVSPPQPPQSGRVADNHTWGIISRFTEITSLTLLYTSWSGKSYRCLEPIARNVTHLELLVTSFDNCDEFFACIAMFPELRSLVLTSLSIGSAFGRDGVRIDPPTKLTSLRYGVHSVYPAIAQRIADWLSYLPNTTLPHFSLTWRAPTEVGLEQVLRALGSRLSHVEMPVSPDSGVTLEGNISNKLQSIIFAVTGDLTKEKMSEITGMLGDIHSVDVQKVEIACSGTSLVDLDVWALQPMDDHLASPQFEDLQHVHFNFSGKSCSAEVDKPEEFAELLRRSLRRANARGALSVCFN